MRDDVRQNVPPNDEEMVEEWERSTEEFQLKAVGAWLLEGDSWRVWLAMAEFVRRDPLETEMTAGIEAALRSVPGVTGVWHEDREQWVADGAPSGRDLVEAAANFVDSIAERARPYVLGK
jgi:hypothetical protein